MKINKLIDLADSDPTIGYLISSHTY